MSKLKTYLITACLIVSATLLSYGQKTLIEYTIKSTLLEEINAASIPDIQAYQRAKFKTHEGGSLLLLSFDRMNIIVYID